MTCQKLSFGCEDERFFPFNLRKKTCFSFYLFFSRLIHFLFLGLVSFFVQSGDKFSMYGTEQKERGKNELKKMKINSSKRAESRITKGAVKKKE